jgi:hypothetical protein
MKALVSIPLVVLILFTGIRINLATHYCGGSVAGTQISFTGKLATCGMESSSSEKPFDNSFDNHCCDNTISVYSICSNYFASSHFLNDPDRSDNLSVEIPVDIAGYQGINEVISKEVIRPPGHFLQGSLRRSVLCIFRI